MLEPHIAPPACVTEDGRRPAETIPQLLRIHAEMAALP